MLHTERSCDGRRGGPGGHVATSGRQPRPERSGGGNARSVLPDADVRRGGFVPRSRPATAASTSGCKMPPNGDPTTFRRDLVSRLSYRPEDRAVARRSVVRPTTRGRTPAARGRERGLTSCRSTRSRRSGMGTTRRLPRVPTPAPFRARSTRHITDRMPCHRQFRYDPPRRSNACRARSDTDSGTAGPCSFERTTWRSAGDRSASSASPQTARMSTVSGE